MHEPWALDETRNLSLRHLMPPLLLLSRPMTMAEEGTTCLREAASAEAGEIVQLQ